MAYSLQNLTRIGGTGEGGTVWAYNASELITDANGPVLKVSGYFNEASNVLQKGDMINISRQVGTSYAHITYIKTITASGVVTHATGTTIAD
jgi:hypothetical protein